MSIGAGHSRIKNRKIEMRNDADCFSVRAAARSELLVGLLALHFGF